MVILAALFLGTGCPAPKLTPAEAFLGPDIKQMRYAAKGCQNRYGPKSCLIEFIKVKELTYHAICKDIRK